MPIAIVPSDGTTIVDLDDPDFMDNGIELGKIIVHPSKGAAADARGRILCHDDEPTLPRQPAVCNDERWWFGVYVLAMVTLIFEFMIFFVVSH